MSVSVFVKMSVQYVCAGGHCASQQMCFLFMATAHRHSSHDYSLPCAQQMEFSNAKSIKCFDATGSKYTINSENKKRSIFLTERFLIEESMAVSCLHFSLFIREEFREKGGLFLC